MDVIKLKPVTKDYIWGGTYFKKYGKGLDKERVSECWELSLNEGNECYNALTSKKITDDFDYSSVGPVANKFPFFPLLIKLIDARDNLSVQVHPNDEYALKHCNSLGKTEMWHVIDALPGSGLYVGFNNDYTKEDVYASLKDGSILDKLNFFEVKKGDTFLIEAGTVHAIGKGVQIIEIQENSNITYRLYDYLRKDADGNYRELHIDKAIDVLSFKKYVKPVLKGDNLVKTPLFTVDRKDFDGDIHIASNHYSFKCITFIEGVGSINNIPFEKFDSFYIPFDKDVDIKGKGTAIISYID